MKLLKSFLVKKRRLIYLIFFNPKEPYLFVKNWNDIYKVSKPGKKTEWAKDRVEEILKENDYNITKAAKTIGNTKQFISFLAKKFGIKKPSKA